MGELQIDGDELVRDPALVGVARGMKGVLVFWEKRGRSSLPH